MCRLIWVFAVYIIHCCLLNSPSVCSVNLTLLMLNKLRCHAHFLFPANQITWSGFLIDIHKLTNNADPDQLVSSEANWSGSTLFAKTGHVVFSKRRINPVTCHNSSRQHYTIINYWGIQYDMISTREYRYWPRRIFKIIIRSINKWPFIGLDVLPA